MGQLSRAGKAFAALARRLLADDSRNVIVEGIENLPREPVLLLEHHTHHFDDAVLLSSILMEHGHEPPSLVIGNNLYRSPLYRLVWNGLGYIRQPRTHDVMPSYRAVWAVLEHGRSVWQSNTRGLAKQGHIATTPGIAGFYFRASQCDTISDMLERHPIVPVATNSALPIGASLRAIRDARGTWPSFDRDMLRAYRKEHARETIVRIGEPIRCAASLRELVERIDDTIVGQHPILPEEYAAFGLALQGAYDVPLDAVPRSVHGRVEDYEDYLLRHREQQGEAVYQAALRQRVGPLDSRFARLGIASIPKKIDFIAAEIERYTKA